MLVRNSLKLVFQASAGMGVGVGVVDSVSVTGSCGVGEKYSTSFASISAGRDREAALLRLLADELGRHQVLGHRIDEFLLCLGDLVDLLLDEGAVVGLNLVVPGHEGELLLPLGGLAVKVPVLQHHGRHPGVDGQGDPIDLGEGRVGLFKVLLVEAETQDHDDQSDDDHHEGEGQPLLLLLFLPAGQLLLGHGRLDRRLLDLLLGHDMDSYRRVAPCRPCHLGRGECVAVPGRPRPA